MISKASITSAIGRIWLAAFALLIASADCRGMPPLIISDDELATYPIIVEAVWIKNPIRNNNHEEQRGEERWLLHSESFTELKVLRVIKGDVQPGNHTLRIGASITWDEEGKNVTQWGSSVWCSDVETVMKPSLWFLRKGKSWDPKDPVEYLSLGNCLEIQKTALENYFLALGSKDPKKEVPKLLSSSQPDELLHALKYTAGLGAWTVWPHCGSYIRKEWGRNGKKRAHSDYSEAVRQAAERKGSENVRGYALALYAAMEGSDSLKHLRAFLADADPDVRAVAVSNLLLHRDATSIAAMTRAITGAEKTSFACEIIEVAFEWREPRLVPLLAAFLESDRWFSAGGHDYHIPAMKAGEALHAITGFRFPYDIQESLRLWSEASRTDEPAARKAYLAKVLPSDWVPLKAELLGDGSTKAACKITNISTHPVTITRLPASGHHGWGGNGADGWPDWDGPQSKRDFITLKPGESMQCDVKIEPYFIYAKPSDRDALINYRYMGREWGQKAWLGNVKVEVGAGWKDEAKIVEVVQRWPNGNLRATGKTYNGMNYGEWNYFNFYGDRIKIEDFTKGRIWICNPDRPENTGAGKAKHEKSGE